MRWFSNMHLCVFKRLEIFISDFHELLFLFFGSLSLFMFALFLLATIVYISHFHKKIYLYGARIYHFLQYNIWIKFYVYQDIRFQYTHKTHIARNYHFKQQLRKINVHSSHFTPYNQFEMLWHLKQAMIYEKRILSQISSDAFKHLNFQFTRLVFCSCLLNTVNHTPD